MNTLDTYISEVGHHLPRKNRQDIEAEIRSTIEDMLDERSKASGKPADEELLMEVLKEYGSPEHVAASYLPERYLIGPRLFPLFWLVLRIVLAVIGAIALVTLGIKLGQPGLDTVSALDTIIDALTGFGTSALSVLGNLVLVFFVLQHFLPEFKIDFKDEADKWDPHSLKAISPTDRISVTETVIEIVGACAAIVIFNFYPQLLRYTPSLNGALEGNIVVWLPVLSEAFFRYVPYLTALWGLTIILDIALLRLGSWNAGTRWASIALKCVSVAIAIVMLLGPSLVGTTETSLIAALGDAEAAGILFTLLNQIVRVALIIAIVAGAVEIIKSIIRIFRSGTK